MARKKTVKKAAEAVYITKIGDTYKAIANTYGITLAKLLRDNYIYNPNAITAGKRLIIKE